MDELQQIRDSVNRLLQKKQQNKRSRLTSNAEFDDETDEDDELYNQRLADILAEDYRVKFDCIRVI